MFDSGQVASKTLFNVKEFGLLMSKLVRYFSIV
jgi:hypothetical protein